MRQVSGQERPVSILCTASAEQEILIYFSTENKGGGVASHLSIAHSRGTFSVTLAGKRPLIPATPQLARFWRFRARLEHRRVVQERTQAQATGAAVSDLESVARATRTNDHARPAERDALADGHFRRFRSASTPPLRSFAKPWAIQRKTRALSRLWRDAATASLRP